MSIGYSRPANSPSTPSPASSIVKPSSRNCRARVSRSAGSSSSTRRRIAVSSVFAASRRVDAHLEHAAVVPEEADAVLDAVAVALFLRLDGARLVAALGLRDGLIQRD